MDQEVIQILHGMTKYSVTLTNNGTCSQSDLVVSCLMFAGPEPRDEKKIRLINDGSECLINNGKPVVKDNPIKFKYATTEKVEFTLIRARFNYS
ncbi:hypothetical protein QJS04_geneDACA015420 [Acorus gramineus]|uniref:Uncharacterized protein n=1 Tax=Acorus gramineus TaxID=55184 RepID=A0AAV9A4V9_ACOGR|nr:hypothetical protein QJS04_geneDACA015420 [Acorus gramineus]